jgi:hypothetical protein
MRITVKTFSTEEAFSPARLSPIITCREYLPTSLLRSTAYFFQVANIDSSIPSVKRTCSILDVLTIEGDVGKDTDSSACIWAQL